MAIFLFPSHSHRCAWPLASLLLLALAIALGSLPHHSEARAFFVFGDSLVDNGNNNYLLTTARADALPYGIDYPGHRPTGRFSNGLNMQDFISQHMGMEPTQPYLSPHLKGEKLLVGANFASAGVGILNDTGIQFANIIRISQQLEYFQQYQTRVTNLYGAERTRSIVNQALVLITLGGNDFVNNYYLVPYSARSRQFSLPDYVRYLIAEYRKVLTRLHDLGARRILVTGTGSMGCAPAEIAMRSSNGQCAPELMRAAALYNPQLIQMIGSLNQQLGSDFFIAANTFAMHMDIMTNPHRYGFLTSNIACCGQGPYNGVGLCTPMSYLCPNRDAFVFWDAFHPTEKANGIMVQQMFTGDNQLMSPLNLADIKAMDSGT